MQGKERVRYREPGSLLRAQLWISKITAKGDPILGNVNAPELLLQSKDVLAPEQVSTMMTTDLRELTSAACAWLGKECPVHDNWVSTLTDMHAKGTLIAAIGITAPPPASAPAAAPAAAAAPSVTIDAGTDIKTFLESASLPEAAGLFEQQGAAFVSDIASMTREFTICRRL